MARTKKKTAGRAAAKKKRSGSFRGGIKGRSWNWGHLNTYVPSQKAWAKDARLRLPASKTTVRGVIFNALRHVKKGTDDEILAVALKLGLAQITKQSPRKQMQVKLRRFAKWGVVVRFAHTKKAERRAKAKGGHAVPIAARRASVRSPRPKPPVATRLTAKATRPTAKGKAKGKANPVRRASLPPVARKRNPAHPNKPVRVRKPVTKSVRVRKPVTKSRLVPPATAVATAVAFEPGDLPLSFAQQVPPEPEIREQAGD